MVARRLRPYSQLCGGSCSTVHFAEIAKFDSVFCSNTRRGNSYARARTKIGPKLRMKSSNNGYLGFKSVRVPINHILMKNQEVLFDGTYIPPKNSAFIYGTMMFVRVVLIRDASLALAKASTIAVRYSVVVR
ncbi:probable peroxisomal acyl-coenzyme A oxidase 1 [Glossina fuscipes]|uniref:Probable peroxisomal acyl-coenzyme A oxidase 1 n=1 Tax=Glossina fuscipes TaxID=7396 RepID=A0A9C6DYX7_9MUSC|nr:probable peroxisomal acyl-coenzyme A oxidase 1 [Glossina fuscipes]KAI9579008.1 hypothetical protein GQX74_005891 [Glossina fuscipes]